MDWLRFLSALPLLMELLVMAGMASGAGASSFLLRSNAAKKMKLLRKLLSRVSADRTLGMIRLKKSGQEELSVIPTSIEDVIRLDVDRSKDPDTFLGSSIEEFTPRRNPEDSTRTTQDSPPHQYRPVECPEPSDGRAVVACPSPDKFGVYKCIDDHKVCNGQPDCPLGEDEDSTACMFHNITVYYFHTLMDSIFGYNPS